MASGFDIWGVVASVIGLLSIFQAIAAFITSQLPLKQLQILEETFHETEGLLTSVEEEGLFHDSGDYLHEAKHKMANICKRMKGLRDDAFTAKTYMDEVKQWWRGVSTEISVCCKELRTLRANISTTSSEARKARTQLRAGAGADRDGAEDAIPIVNTKDDTSRNIHSDGAALLNAEKAAGDVTTGSHGGIITPSLTISTQDRYVYSPTTTGVILEGCISVGRLEEGRRGDPGSSPETQPAVADLSEGASRSWSDSTDTPPSYHRQNSLPPYSATVLPRYTITSADAARVTRKLVKAYRRNLMVHNVPWRSSAAQRAGQPAVSAAASARATDRPSNSTRHWKLLEERAKFRLRPSVAVLPYKEALIPSPHAAGVMEVCRCSCSDNVQRMAV